MGINIGPTHSRYVLLARPQQDYSHGTPLYLRAIVFERPLQGMNVNSKASRIYRRLADICRTYSSCAAFLCSQSYF